MIFVFLTKLTTVLIILVTNSFRKQETKCSKFETIKMCLDPCVVALAVAAVKFVFVSV